ncbi:glycoside hydrolase superfamily [Aspergillus transmontanensis]|uniref:chitinase n=1 Tax=Aspergillus transmontanensis TaxID=1034304 RepID=A0A5N6W1T5_9EURO|nr:glycoside hydrolase superfamily [Aspergillus transmontanensis]
MVFSQGPKWHLLSLLFACLALQVLSQSVSGTECDNSTPGCELPKVEGDSKPLEQQKCSGTSSKQRYIGHYALRNLNQYCDTIEPSDINLEPWTHLYLIDNQITPNHSVITQPWDNEQRKRWKEFVDLKIKKPSLKTYITVVLYQTELGEPNPIFSDMVRSFEKRKQLIDAIVKVMDEFKFDGFNFDVTWRDLWQAEPQNSVLFLKELHETFGDKYGISADFRATTCGLSHLDLAGMVEHLDHANFVTYDRNGCVGEQAWPEFPDRFNIERSLSLFRQANIDPNKLSAYLNVEGQQYNLEDPKCNTPGCPMVESKIDGECSGATTKITAYEIERLMKAWSPEVHYNTSNAYNWFAYDASLWLSFDNARSLKQKADRANENCLGGFMVGSISSGGPATLANPNDLDPSDTSMRGTRLTKPYNGTNGRSSTEDTSSATSIQSDSLSTETSNNDTDTNANTEGLSCHPAIGSVHVPIAQQDCDPNSTLTAAHEPDTPVNAEEYTPSPTLAAPHEASTSDEPNAMGPKPTLTLAHQIGTPSNTAEKANDEGTTPGEPINAP